MSMTTGEFDYNGIFRLAPTETHETYAEIPFPTVSYILWILFIILMPILLTNMLVCSIVTIGLNGQVDCYFVISPLNRLAWLLITSKEH